MGIMLIGYVFLASFLLAVGLVPIVMRLASRWNIVDKPGVRKIHSTPKPLLGGLAIYLAFMIVVAGPIALAVAFGDQAWLSERLPWLVSRMPRLIQVLPKLLLILGCGTLMMIVGVCDDAMKDRFSYKWKFVGQIVAAILLVAGGVRTEFMPGHALDVVVSVLWVVGITNSFNLLDNMDGLSAGVAVVAALVFFCATWFQGQIFMALILMTLAGSASGFLIYNFKPSKLFMGDSGSLFLGFMFGALTLAASYRIPQGSSLLPVAMPVVILSVPLYDTFSVILIRMMEKRPVFVGDKSHFSHRLVALGFSERGAVLLIYLIGLCVGCGALLLPYIPVWGSILVMVQTVMVYLLITALMVVSMKNKK